MNLKKNAGYPNRISPHEFVRDGYRELVLNGLVAVFCDGHSVERISIEGRLSTAYLVHGCTLSPLSTYNHCLLVTPIELPADLSKPTFFKSMR